MPRNARALPFILALAMATPAAAQDGGLPDWVEQDPFSNEEDDPLIVELYAMNPRLNKKTITFTRMNVPR